MGNDTLDYCWKVEPHVMIFDSAKVFKEFCLEIKEVQAKLLVDQMYDTVTSHVRFYQEYKSGDTPMPEFYYNHVSAYHPDSVSCVGNALAMREGLLNPESYFMKHYPDLERYIYFVCSNFVSYTWLEEIPNHRKICPAMHSAPYKEHVLVALKISLNGRYGYVLMDLGYNMSFPVIVMADGNPPHTGTFFHSWKRGSVEQSFELQGNYIHWVEEDSGENSAPPRNRWIYVAKKFTKLLEAEKRTRVSFFHAMIKRGLSGPEAGIYYGFGKYAGVNVFIKSTNDNEDSVSIVIPFDYLVTDQNSNAEYEAVIGKCTIRMKMDKKDLRKIMKTIAELKNDKPFLDSASKLSAEFTAIVEGSWKNE